MAESSTMLSESQTKGAPITGFHSDQVLEQRQKTHQWFPGAGVARTPRGTRKLWE